MLRITSILFLFALTLLGSGFSSGHLRPNNAATSWNDSLSLIRYRNPLLLDFVDVKSTGDSLDRKHNPGLRFPIPMHFADTIETESQLILSISCIGTSFELCGNIVIEDSTIHLLYWYNPFSTPTMSRRKHVLTYVINIKNGYKYKYEINDVGSCVARYEQSTEWDSIKRIMRYSNSTHLLYAFTKREAYGFDCTQFNPVTFYDSIRTDTSLIIRLSGNQNETYDGTASLMGNDLVLYYYVESHRPNKECPLIEYHLQLPKRPYNIKIVELKI